MEALLGIAANNLPLACAIAFAAYLAEKRFGKILASLGIMNQKLDDHFDNCPSAKHPRK